MTLTEFFESKEVELPRGGFEEDKEAFDAFLKNVFDEYFKHVQTLGDAEFSIICSEVKNSVGKIEELYEQIVSAVKQHLDGFPSRAYETFVKSLKAVNSHIERLATSLCEFDPNTPPEPWSDIDLRCTIHPSLYRMRQDRAVASNGALSRKDIFHIPFQKRRLVSNQRYSVTGLPCLYLGSSIWICWDELGRPDLDSVFVSRFRFAEKTRVLDFQLPPNETWQIFKHAHQSKSSIPSAPPSEVLDRYNDMVMASYIVCWPLIAACSIRVDSGAGPFFPEYIVPQLLLQWVTMDRRIDGIRYFSTRPSLPDFYLNTNCVFPAREIKPTGHCSHLKKKLHLTAPIPWEILEMRNLPDRFDPGPSNLRAAVRLTDNLPARYSSTGFYLAEGRLRQIERPDGVTPSGSGPVED